MTSASSTSSACNIKCIRAGALSHLRTAYGLTAYHSSVETQLELLISWTYHQTWASPQPGQTDTDHFLHFNSPLLDKSHKIPLLTPAIRSCILPQGSFLVIWLTSHCAPWEAFFKLSPLPHPHQAFPHLLRPPLAGRAFFLPSQTPCLGLHLSSSSLGHSTETTFSL